MAISALSHGPRRSSAVVSSPRKQQWRKSHQLVGIALTLRPRTDITLSNKIATALHGWFLEQVKLTDELLSAELHDNQAQKAFALSSLLDGHSNSLRSAGDRISLQADQPYQLVITGLSQPVCNWLKAWVSDLPTAIQFRRGVQIPIVGWALLHPPATYAQLLMTAQKEASSSTSSSTHKTSSHKTKITLSFLSPTSFRSKGNHLPLPLPKNLFHSYLRRWNAFAARHIDEDAFLDWIETEVTIVRYDLHTQKTAVAKKGLVTGFVGTLVLALSARGQRHETFTTYFLMLSQYAAYCGTGHKTTFGLGQTRLGGLTVPKLAADVALPVTGDSAEAQQLAVQYTQTALRIEELKGYFLRNRQQGGERAARKAATMATIVARREAGDGLRAIAQDLRLSYETVKSYSKWARRELETGEVRQR